MNQPALIAAIAADPTSNTPWLVYADWLLEQGDPRGEVISLELAFEGGLVDPQVKERIRHLVADEDALLSPRLRAQAHHWDFEFRRGFINRADLCSSSSFVLAADPIGLEAVDALFADPHAVLLRSLDLSELPAMDVFSVAFASPRLALRHLRIFDLGAQASRLNGCVPDLAELTLYRSDDGAVVEALSHDKLQTLESNTNACPAAGTGALRLPALESLTWLIDQDDLLFRPRSILSCPPSRLSALTLIPANRDGDPVAFPQDMLTFLASSPVALQLRSLTLEFLSQSHVAELCDRAAAFPKLENLELRLMYSALEPLPEPDLRERFERVFARTKLEVNWKILDN